MHDQEAVEMTSSIRASSRASSPALHDPYPGDVPEQGSGYQPLKRSTQRATTTTLDAFWIMEIAGVVVSIACLTAIAITLFIHDRQPLSSWTFYLSLNTVVSILATISKTTILVAVTAAISQGKWNMFKAGPHPLKLFQDIDQASRGGIGSLRAIFNFHTGFTTTCGAFITVTSLLFQPMIQATINNNSGASGNDTLQALVGGTSFLDGGTLYTREMGYGNGYRVFDTHADIGLQIAITGGFATSQQTNASTQLVWTCPTANCAWPIYASLAVCSKCCDVSSLLTSRSTSGTMSSAYNDRSSNTAVWSEPWTNFTQYTLEHANLTLGNWNTYRAVPPKNMNYSTPEYMVAKSEKLPERTANFQHYESLLMSFSMIKADPSYLNNGSMWQEVRPAAMECGLFLCLQAYNTTIESGRLVETVIASTRRKTPQSWQIKALRGQEGANLTNLKKLNWNPINSNRFLYRDSFDLDASNLNISFPDANYTFSATQVALYSTVDYLDGLLKVEGTSYVLDADYAAVYGNVTDILEYTTPTVQSLFQSSNLKDTFINVADSMTSYFRNTGNYKQIKRWTIHYEIRWPFITLPVFVVFGGGILLMISIFQTHRQGMAVWKDNIIAAMVYSVSPGTRSQLRQMLRYQKLDDVGDLVVHMHELEDGVELSTMPPSEAMDDEDVDRTSMTSSRRVSDEDSLVPSASPIDLGDQDFATSQALVTPIPTRRTSDLPH